jgi:hypothetical protein
VQIGALVPLSRPGWTEAGRHLLAWWLSRDKKNAIR